MDNIHVVKEATLTVETNAFSPSSSIPWFNILKTASKLNKLLKISLNVLKLK